jgi:hypothetical protein
LDSNALSPFTPTKKDFDSSTTASSSTSSANIDHSRHIRRQQLGSSSPDRDPHISHQHQHQHHHQQAKDSHLITSSSATTPSRQLHSVLSPKKDALNSANDSARYSIELASVPVYTTDTEESGLGTPRVAWTDHSTVDNSYSSLDTTAEQHASFFDQFSQWYLKFLSMCLVLDFEVAYMS